MDTELEMKSISERGIKFENNFLSVLKGFEKCLPKLVLRNLAVQPNKFKNFAEPDHDVMQDAHVSMAMDNKQNMEQRELQYYATVRKPMPSPIRDISTLERIPGIFVKALYLSRFHLSLTSLCCFRFPGPM